MDVTTRVNRRLTRAFIAQAPVEVTLIPRTKVPRAAGGFSWEDGEPRPPQTVKLNEPGNVPLPTVTIDGVQREAEFEMIGYHDATFGRFDRFEHAGARWEVLEVAHFNGWEQRALVAKIG